MTTSFWSLLLILSRIVIGTTFILSVIGKLKNLKFFRQAIISFQVLPESWSAIVVAMVLVAETLAATGMIAGGNAQSAGFLLAMLLLLVFTGALLSVIVRRIQTSCNCFGAKAKKVTAMDIVRNAGLILWAGFGLTATFLVPVSKVELPIAELIILVFAGVFFAVFWNNSGEIIDVIFGS